ncbi:hypothetical protein F5X96DRAFT_431361 [Biscogniauxia mediterranea]|nr:hypothetical protein F5X96DRAFT_431361 [Biscogniauxia mediterranea]
MESKTQRHQSRILREMNQNTENPFSPPSSTGSHGTVTLTSEISHIPDMPECESTRRMDDTDVKLPPHVAARQGAKAPHPLSFNVNTSALGRAFPEWEERYPVSHNMNMWERIEMQENIDSPTSSTVATPSAYNTDRFKVSDRWLRERVKTLV